MYCIFNKISDYKALHVQSYCGGGGGGVVDRWGGEIGGISECFWSTYYQLNSVCLWWWGCAEGCPMTEGGGRREMGGGGVISRCSWTISSVEQWVCWGGGLGVVQRRMEEGGGLQVRCGKGGGGVISRCSWTMSLRCSVEVLPALIFNLPHLTELIQ